MRASLLIALLFVCAPVALHSQVPATTADTTTATTADTTTATTANLVPPRTVPPPSHHLFNSCARKHALVWGASSAAVGAVAGALLGVLPAAALSLLKQHDAARAALWLPTGLVGGVSGLVGAGAGVARCVM
jgi:hypothetical protein